MIKVQNLKKTYKGDLFKKKKPSLLGLNLEVKPGDVYGFIGPNGAGKSTTIKILLNLLNADGGSVELFGNLTPGIKAQERMGYLPEHPYFYDFLTGREILQYYGKLMGLKGSDLNRAIDEALGRVQADKPWIDSRLRRYSKGMVQRVGMAQAIMHKPELLILDEPMSGLDPVGRKDVRESILSLHRQGTTVFYSSHVLGDVQQISTRIGMIIGGEMRMEGSVNELLKREDDGFEITLSEGVHCPVAGVTQKGTQLLCANAVEKNEVLQWALDKNVEVIRMQNHFQNLEELLSKEIALHG